MTKSKTFYLRVTVEEFNILHEQAKKANISLSQFIHATLVKQKILQDHSTDIIDIMNG
ncbi:MAG: hypothetical protein HQK91_11710 [Nitrospirae bacterium]|nr:hypothetical protein [Nitrospirota bacterium]